MSIQYSGGSIQNNSFSGNTTANLIAGIQTTLTAAGWTVVSGGGTTNLLMQTAQTPQGLAMRYKFHDNGLTISSQATIQISIQLVSGAIVGLDNSLNAPWVRVNAVTNFRCIAGPYYFWLMIPGSFADYGQFAFGGVPWTASFQSSTTQLGYLCAQAKGNSTSVFETWRFANTCCGRSSLPSQQLIYNSLYVSTDSFSLNGDGDACLLKGWFPAWQTDNGGAVGIVSATSKTTQFSDGSFTAADPWIAWAIQRNTYPAGGDPSSIVGMLWDAVFIYDSSLAGDTTTTFNGHNWYLITNNATPTLWVATS